jgi:hypothetical protein
VDLTLTPRVKVIALAGLLAALAMVAGMQILARKQASSAATPIPTVHPIRHVVAPTPTAKPAHKVGTAKKTVATHRAVHKKSVAAKPKATPAVTVAAAPAAPAATPAPTASADVSVSSTMPAPLAAVLRKFPVVVVSIYDPQSQVDAIAYAEAQAGAKAAGAGFLPVNVLDDKVAAPITALLPDGGLLPDPGVLVFQRPGTLVNQFNGFADRDMVAQAAVNARP